MKKRLLERNKKPSLDRQESKIRKIEKQSSRREFIKQAGYKCITLAGLTFIANSNNKTFACAPPPPPGCPAMYCAQGYNCPPPGVTGFSCVDDFRCPDGNTCKDGGFGCGNPLGASQGNRCNTNTCSILNKCNDLNSCPVDFKCETYFVCESKTVNTCTLGANFKCDQVNT